VWIVLILGGVALLVVTCLGVGVGAVYFMFGAYKTAEAEAKAEYSDSERVSLTPPGINNPAPNPPFGGNPGNAPPGGLDQGMKPDCQVLWGSTWFDAKILKKENDRWFIHYVGWGNNWDEWVGKERIRFNK
jgi:hypothetical protein